MSTEEYEREYVEFMAEIEERPKEELRKELEELRKAIIGDDPHKPVTRTMLWRIFVLLVRDHYMLGVIINNFQDEYRDDWEILTTSIVELLNELRQGESDDEKEPKESTDSGSPYV